MHSRWRMMKATSSLSGLPGILEKGEMMEWVDRFYDEYYFRPKAAWRIVRKAIFNNNDRKRLYKEAKTIMSSRSKRQKYVAERTRSQRPCQPKAAEERRLALNQLRMKPDSVEDASFAAIVILSNAFGNFFLTLGNAASRRTLTTRRCPISAIFNPWVMLGIRC